ncbi:Class E vacuolar protein-sorting machinery protein hse1 [Schizosaccharomyces pombe]
MFRGKPNSIETLILQATDEKNTKEKWDVIMDACDQLSSTSEDVGRNSIKFLNKRLDTANANIQLLALTLTDAIVKNCKTSIVREISSRTFTDSLLKIASDSTTHNRVRSRIAVLVNEWAEIMKKDPNMSLMQDICEKIRKLDIVDLRAPKKPEKEAMNELELKREEEELQYALALSLSESTAQSNKVENPQSTKDEPPQKTNQRQESNLATSPASTVSRVRALYDFAATEQGELSFKKGDIILVLESVYKDWWKGSCKNAVGIFPVNYVQRVVEPTIEQQRQSAHMEQQVFDALPQIDELLDTLSTASPDAADDDALQGKYHAMIALRPKLVRLIEKYASQKEELMDLNERLLVARRDYEKLYEQSMSEMRNF